MSDDGYKCISGKPSSANCFDATKVRLLDAIAALLKGNFVQLKTLPKSKVDAKDIFQFSRRCNRTLEGMTEIFNK